MTLATTSAPTEPTMGSTPNLGPAPNRHQPIMSTRPQNVKERVRLLTPTDMSAEGLIEPSLEVRLPMIDGTEATRKKETVAMRKVAVVDQGANQQNARSILPVIGQAPDHILILLRGERKKENQFLQILLLPIDLIRKSLVRLVLVTNLCHQEIEVLRALVMNM